MLSVVVYNNELTFPPLSVFVSPYFIHDASCVMLNIDWTPLGLYLYWQNDYLHVKHYQTHLITDHVSRHGNVRSSIRLFLHFWHQLTFDLHICISMVMTIVRRGIESQGHRSRSNMCYMSIHSGVLRLMAVIVGFHDYVISDISKTILQDQHQRTTTLDVIGCELSRQGVQHGATEARDSQHMWAW